MSFWIPIWRNLAQTEIKGYLYSCTDCNNTIMFTGYSEKCLVCSADIEINTIPQWLKEKKVSG